MKKINNKKLKNTYRRKSRSKSVLRFRDSSVGNECPQCGVSMTKSAPPGEDPSSVTIEHIQPLDFKYGGSCNLSNLEIICDSCNNKRNILKKNYEIRGDILPDKFWYASLYHKLPYYNKILQEIYSQEWEELQKLIIRDMNMARDTGLIET